MEARCGQRLEADIRHFRPNLVVSTGSGGGTDSGTGYTTVEDGWSQLGIPVTRLPRGKGTGTAPTSPVSISFLITHPCVRCSMVNILPSCGVMTSNVLSSVKSYRKLQSDSHTATAALPGNSNSPGKDKDKDKGNIYFGQFCKYGPEADTLFSEGMLGIIRTNVHVYPM